MSMSAYSDLFYAKFMSSHYFEHVQRTMMLIEADKCLHLRKSSLWLALAGGRTRFLALAKSYGGQFRSIWEHCLLYSNGSTDGNVNKSIEICLTHMVRGPPSRRT